MTTIMPLTININKAKKVTISTRNRECLTPNSTSKSIINSNQNILLNTKYLLIFNADLSRIATNDISKHPLRKLKRLVNESQTHIKQLSNQSGYISHQQLIEKITSNIKNKIDYSLMYDFVITSLPQNIPLVCNIAIRYSNIYEQFYPQFIMTLNSNERQILMARKELRLTSIVYKIYFGLNEKCCIGKVESDFFGNEFKIYEKILEKQYRNCNRYNKNQNNQKKKLIGIIKYNCPILNLKREPRTMSVFLPKTIKAFPNRYNKLNKTSISYGTDKLKKASNINVIDIKDTQHSYEKVEEKEREQDDNVYYMNNKRPIWSRSK